MPALRIEIAGGGTAGHLFPGLALAQEFQARFPDCRIQFWGTRRGIEYRLKQSLGYPLRTIPIRGFQRQFRGSNFLIPFQLLGSVFYVLFYFLLHRPSLVIGTGGYVSGPVVGGAVLLRIPTAIHEQNSYPGVTTRVLARWVRRVYLTYKSSQEYLKGDTPVRVYGNPVRKIQKNLNREEASKEFGLDPKKKTILVFGGSQGALGINNLLEQVVPGLLADPDYQLLWATGAAHFQGIQERLGKIPGLHLYPFIEQIYSAYACADLVICRAGATTLAELTCLGVPAILIPFPHATAGHQAYNARELERTGAAVCLLEEETTPERILQEINKLFKNKSLLQEMKSRMNDQARPNAAHDIVSDLYRSLLSD